MLVQTVHLKKLFENGKKTPLKLDRTDRSSANTIENVDGKFEFHELLDSAYLVELEKRGVTRVAVLLERDDIENLRKLFPGEYEAAQFEETPDEILRKIKMYEELNKYSKKYRDAFLMQEVTAVKDGIRQVIFKNGTQITEQTIMLIKVRCGDKNRYQYSLNEQGILVFVNDPMRNLTIKIDVLAVFSKSPIPVMIGETPEEAFQLFVNKKPKLILMTHLDSSTETKEFFLRCIEADPFLKFINYNASPSANRDQEFAKIMLTYNSGYEAALELFKKAKSENKPTLESKIRNPIMDRLEMLRNKFSHSGYVEMRYYLFRLGLKFNVRTMEIMLEKIKSDHQAL